MNALNMKHISEECASGLKKGSWDNSVWIEMVITSQRHKRGCLPFRLGLSETEYAAVRHYYSGRTNLSVCDWDGVPEDDVRQELLQLRWQEAEDIRNLLVSHRRGHDPGEFWLSAIVAAGCFGGDHLWRDLGLSNREALSALLGFNFPELVIKNTRDMKWKKFFYKQLCDQSGCYICRAPICEQCATYADCFGPEK